MRNWTKLCYAHFISFQFLKTARSLWHFNISQLFNNVVEGKVWGLGYKLCWRKKKLCVIRRSWPSGGVILLWHHPSQQSEVGGLTSDVWVSVWSVMSSLSLKVTSHMWHRVSPGSCTWGERRRFFPVAPLPNSSLQNRSRPWIIH